MDASRGLVAEDECLKPTSLSPSNPTLALAYAGPEAFAIIQMSNVVSQVRPRPAVTRRLVDAALGAAGRTTSPTSSIPAEQLGLPNAQRL
jgi:hypothetical protein